MDTHMIPPRELSLTEPARRPECPRIPGNSVTERSPSSDRLSEESRWLELADCLATTLSCRESSAEDGRAGSSYPAETGPGRSAEPKGPSLASAHFAQADSNLKECQDSRLQALTGVRVRACLAEVSAYRSEGALHEMSGPQEVLVRVNGHNALFLVNRDNVPSASQINQLSQAVFQKREFYDDDLDKKVYTFFHRPSRSMLFVDPQTKEVRFLSPRASSSSSDDDDDEEETWSAGVVSLNGPGRPSGPVNGADCGSVPDPCCLFFLEGGNNETSIQPTVCDNASLVVDREDLSVRVAEGRRYVFSLLPYDSKADNDDGKELNKLLRTSTHAVLLVNDHS
ncbi:uncharacterized protein LOC143285165 [Babylonia areolata]|uniref:uncharacterized protein LOC143285165 n=1 Tax=Babylonia areolata TaxID=304850 RepID=UPI003FD40D84